MQPLEETPEVLLRILQGGRHHLLDTMYHLPGPGHHLGVGEVVGGGARAVRGEIVKGEREVLGVSAIAISRRTLSRAIAIGWKVVGA